MKETRRISILLFSVKQKVSNLVLTKQQCLGRIRLVETYFTKEDVFFLHLTVSLLLLVYAAYCTEPDVCSDDRVFLGIARDREDIINAMTVIVQTMQPANCDAGVQCRKFC